MNDRPYHVLLVEDSTTQAISLTALLEGEGWKVTWVASAEKAFFALRESRPDLILLDYHLPGIRGDEVCRRIRMNVDMRGMPIVMLTSQEGQQVQGLDSGADDFVAKSTKSEVLLLRLRTLLQKSDQGGRILTGPDESLREVRLLAIDDSAIFLERLTHELSAEGYKLETRTDAEEGLKRLREGGLDGVIIDLVMPKMDGFEVCRQVNDLRRTAQFPLISILLTGAESTENLSKALDAGADDFVGKSNDFSILKGRIRALLRRKFFAEENGRILQELKLKELEALHERSEKEAAQARAALVEELQARTEELNRSREELHKANSAKDQFLAMLSHELRTPLTPVLAVVEDRSRDASLPQDLRQDFEMIYRNVKLETHLIDDLLDLTRITQGKLEVKQEPVDLQKIVREVLEMCSAVPRKLPTITFHGQNGGPAMLTGDPVRLAQVVWNLVQNAAKFTPPEGRIDLYLSQKPTTDGPIMVLEVVDTGIGIKPEILGRIFEAFQQESRQTTRTFGGLGLGLAISRAIVELHHGRLSASSEGTGKGATFRLELPVSVKAQSADHAEPEKTEGLPPAAPVQAPPPPGKSILLVEDHADTRDTLARLLRRRGHQVHVAGSMSEAISAAATIQHLDVLISDFNLPDGDGFQALAAIRQKHSVYAITMSGFGMEEDVRRSLEAGFACHLTKPVDFAKLEQAIAQAG